MGGSEGETHRTSRLNCESLEGSTLKLDPSHWIGFCGAAADRRWFTAVFKSIGEAVPNLRWTIEDIKVIGNQIVVRGRATGTPTGDFWGAKPTGKSFNTMAIDIFTVKNGKLASAFHVENWMAALQQLAK